MYRSAVVAAAKVDAIAAAAKVDAIATAAKVDATAAADRQPGAAAAAAAAAATDDVPLSGLVHWQQCICCSQRIDAMKRSLTLLRPLC